MKTPMIIGPLRVGIRRRPVVHCATSNEPVEAPRMAERFSKPPPPTPRANEGEPVGAPRMAEQLKREGR